MSGTATIRASATVAMIDESVSWVLREPRRSATSGHPDGRQQADAVEHRDQRARGVRRPAALDEDVRKPRDDP